MKTKGIIRKVDELGRIVVPVEFRRHLDIEIKDSVEIYLQDGQVVIKKLQTSCVFCGKTKGVTEFSDKIICKDCVGKIATL